MKTEVRTTKFIITLKTQGNTYFFSLQSMKTPTERTWGKTSRIPFTNKHVLFLDHDCIDKTTLDDELNALIEEFKLGNLHVFKLDRELAYHVVCLDHFTLNEVKTVVQSSSCDLGFVIAPRFDKFRNWVLRDATKGKRGRPTFAYSIESPYDGMRKQSLAHAMFLYDYYGLVTVLKNPDGNDTIKLESYLTASRTGRN